MDMSLSKLWDRVKDRETCCAAIHGLQSQTWLNWTTANKHIWTSLVAQSVKNLSTTQETIFKAHYGIPGLPKLSCFMFTHVLLNDIIPPEGPLIMNGRLQRKLHFYIHWTLRITLSSDRLSVVDSHRKWRPWAWTLQPGTTTCSWGTRRASRKSRGKGRKGAPSKPAV